MRAAQEEHNVELANYGAMSDSLPTNAPNPDDVPDAPSDTAAAQNVPQPPDAPAQTEETQTGDANDEELNVPHDPEALANDRAGFKFLAVGFAIFFALIAICASIVALVMKSMGI